MIASHVLARRRDQKRHTDGSVGSGGNAESDEERNPVALSLLIEGEQKLLALFDARQTSADGRLAAALTGALALPAATLALADPLKANEERLQWGYAGVVLGVIILVALRTWSGWLRRRRLRPKEPGKKPSKHPLVSTESQDAADARRGWWGFDGSADPIAVQDCALRLWRTRAQHSREIAQVKDVCAFVGGVVFVLTLMGMGVLVALD